MTCRVEFDLRRRTVAWIRAIAALALGVVLSCAALPPSPAAAAELDYPQIIRVRYEAKDPHVGGYLAVWVEREKIFYGLDSKLYPAARYVEVTHVTPAPGSITLTFIEVATVNSTVPDFFHLSGNVRFRVSGMEITASNIPPMKRSAKAPANPP